MTSTNPEEDWDAVAELKTWTDMAQQAVLFQDKLEQKPGSKAFRDYALFLAELDVCVYITQPKYFTSRLAFVAELRQLMLVPTTPSRPVSSLERYQREQKNFLECLLSSYVRASDPPGKDA